jgi:fructosamine-3-kinase
MLEPLAAQLESILGVTPRRITPKIGGMIGQVYRVDLPDHTRLVAKVAASADARLSLEGYMLAYLKEHSALPVPAVIHNSDSLLLMDFVEGDSRFNAAAQRHGAELLAALHNIRSDHFGLERDTLIGGLHQPNPLSTSWIDFFRDHRLFYMAGEALNVGHLPGTFLPRIHHFAEHLSEWLTEPEYPSFIHGDVWTTNVLASGGRITGFLDPAVYYAQSEIELAFITLG